MPFISFGKCKRKNIFIISSIILSYLIYQTQLTSSFFYECRDYDTPPFLPLYLSFSFLGSFLIGGILYIIIEKKNKNEKSNKIKSEDKTKKNIDIALLYNKNQKKISIQIKYFILASLLELFSNFSFYCILYDFLDIESKILFNGLEIIIIKIIGKFIFKNQLYKHQIISIIILLFLLVLAFIARTQFLSDVINDKLTLEETFQKYVKLSYEQKSDNYLIYFRLIFIFIGNILASLSVWYDNWLMTIKLCSPNLLLFFKGLFGFIPSFLIQILLFLFLGERTKLKEDENINIINILKRTSFPFSSFKSWINIILIIVFFILVSGYQFTIVYTNNKFIPEFVGLVSIFASGLLIISNQIINILKSYTDIKILYLIIPFFYFIISFITSLIICEIVILNFCGCDKNIESNIDKRGYLESNRSFKQYIEDEIEEEKVSIDDISGNSQEF